MNPAEEIIWKNIQRKDLSVFESFYKQNYKSFFLMACKYVKAPAQAQEIVNDVFVKLWQDGHDMVIESSLKSYIYRAIINRSINALNKDKKDLQNQKELSYRPEETLKRASNKSGIFRWLARNVIFFCCRIRSVL